MLGASTAVATPAAAVITANAKYMVGEASAEMLGAGESGCRVSDAPNAASVALAAASAAVAAAAKAAGSMAAAGGGIADGMLGSGLGSPSALGIAAAADTAAVGTLSLRNRRTF
jgi:hypothetical protein